MIQKYYNNWDVLLIGGISGSGKTTIARQLGLRLGLPWLQVDDLRLAFQWSQVTLPQRTKDLYFFLGSHVWQLAPEHLCTSLIAIGEVLSPAIEIVVENHLDTETPTIIEGDAILPSLLIRPALQKHMHNKRIRVVFLIESKEENIFTNIQERGRGTAERTEKELRTEARAKWLYGQWLALEAQRLQLPLLEVRPWNSLSDRILNTKFP
jgi:2-phosphoglycerate kinase